MSAASDKRPKTKTPGAALIGSSALLAIADISLQRERIANTTIYDVGFCRTGEGEEGISINMYLADSSALRLESLCQSIRSLKPLIEGRPHRITINADSFHFGPLSRRVPTDNLMPSAHNIANSMFGLKSCVKH